jgi:hypothetical protein
MVCLSWRRRGLGIIGWRRIDRLRGCPAEAADFRRRCWKAWLLTSTLRQLGQQETLRVGKDVISEMAVLMA